MQRVYSGWLRWRCRRLTQKLNIQFAFSPSFVKVWCECKNWSRLQQSSTWRSRSASWPRVTKMPGRFLRNWRKTKSFLFSLTVPIAWLQSSLSRYVQRLSRVSFITLLCRISNTSLTYGSKNCWFLSTQCCFMLYLMKTISLFSNAYTVDLNDSQKKNDQPNCCDWQRSTRELITSEISNPTWHFCLLLHFFLHFAAFIDGNDDWVLPFLLHDFGEKNTQPNLLMVDTRESKNQSSFMR